MVFLESFVGTVGTCNIGLRSWESKGTRKVLVNGG